MSRGVYVTIAFKSRNFGLRHAGHDRKINLPQAAAGSFKAYEETG